MLHEMFATAKPRKDQHVRKLTGEMEGQPRRLSASTGSMAADLVRDFSDLECPQCGNIYMTDSLFCRICGNRRRELPNTIPEYFPRSGSTGIRVTSKVMNGKNPMQSFHEVDERRVVEPVVGWQDQKQPRGGTQRVASLSPELAEDTWTFSTPRGHTQSTSVTTKESLRSSSSDGKSRLTYVHSLESKLDALQDTNKRLLNQLEVEQAHVSYLQAKLRAEPEPTFSADDISRAADLERASVAFNAWNRVALRAGCERWHHAEAAFEELDSENASLLKLSQTSSQRAQEAEIHLAHVEAQLASERKRLGQEEAQASESAHESTMLQASALQVGQKVKALADQLSAVETRLGEERARLTSEEAEVRELRMAASATKIAHNENRQLLANKLSLTEGLLAEERFKLSTVESNAREALADRASSAKALELQKASVKQFEADFKRAETETNELRGELQDLLTARVEAERRAAAAEVENSHARAALLIAESEGVHAKRMETASSRRAEEATKHASELAAQLQRIESQHRKSEEAARLADEAHEAQLCAERETNALRLQQAALEVDISKASAASAAVEARHFQDMLVKANVLQASANLSSPEAAHSPTAATLALRLEAKLVGRSSAGEMEEAATELRRWRLVGTPPKLAGSALQRGLTARLEELREHLAAAKAIRACGLRHAGDGGAAAAMAAVAVAAARDATNLDRIEALSAELADMQEVNAVVEGLMDDLRSETKGSLSTDCDSEERQGDRVQGQPEVEAFTSELLEALTNCQAELERVRQ